MSKKPTVLMILDGYGLSDKTEGNAVKQAKTPVMDKLIAKYPFVQGEASGMAVGLPDGQMGNSEVGHTNMGAGRIVYQMLVKISKSIQDGDFFENKALVAAMENCKKNDSALHLMGLLSPGGVHSHMEHLYGLLEMAKKNGLEKVYVHAYLDGRDVPPSSAAEYMEELVAKIKEIGVGSVATISGRFYAMDRDNAWDREEKAYSALVYGEGVQADDPVQAIKDSYANDVTDEFMLPTVVDKNGMIHENDSVIFFNFRPDRARQLTRAFVDPEFTGFERRNGYFPLTFVCMAQYDAEMPNVLVAFPPEELKMTFGEYLAKHGKKQLRLAETQKYAHVTFFFNGGEEKQFEGEDRILVNSPKVATFDMQPEMSAYEVCDNLVESIRSDKYDVIIVNFANPDMVGHTGIMEAAIKAIETVDECVGKTVDAILDVDGQMFICADHGNAEKLLDELSQIKKYDWIVFTSQNAVHLFFAEADKKQIDRREFAKVRFAVVGSGTKKALETYGFYADYMPKQFTTEALAKGLTDVVKPGEHLLLPRALQASEELVLELQKKSVTITEIPFYDVEGAFSGDLSMWKNMDVAAFFSASGVEAFVSRMGKDKIGEWERDRKKEHVAVAAIGEVTKKRLQAYGIDVDVVPEQCDLEHLGRALEQFYQ